MKLLKYALLPVVALSLVVTLTTCDKGPDKAKWTIIAYYDGNCDLDLTKNGNSWVIAEAQEIERVGSTDEVQVVGMVGSLKTGGQCKYYRLEKHDNELPDQLSSTVLEDLGSKDMSDKATLNNFIRYCTEEYPADRYMLMIKNHGSGWRGACVDEQLGGGHIMSMPEIREALDTFHFDVIAFDACLMSMVEVAYELRARADYLVASQFVTYAGTYGGEEWMTYLTGNPDAGGLDLGKQIVTACENANKRNSFIGHMAVTDLSKLDALASRISTLGSDLVTHTGQYAGEVFDAFYQTHSTELDDPTFCDLREFCVKLKDEPGLKTIQKIVDDCNDVISGINDAVPMTKTNAVGISRGGLCLYFPYDDTLFDSTNYVKCQFESVKWQNFLSKFIAARGGGGGGDKGAAYITSTPDGATVWWDGNNTGATTPLLIYNTPAGSHQVKLTMTGYSDWDSTVSVVANDTIQVHGTLTGGGGQTCTVTGTVTWPGHALSNYCIAFLDTTDGANIYELMNTTVNPSTGSFGFQFQISGNMLVLADAWDDVNNSGWPPDAGDGWGFYDKDGDNQWTVNDQFTIGPGMSVTNINITLEQESFDGRPRQLTW